MATNNSEFLRRRMKELREKNGLTMDEMAKRLGYEQKSTISRVESGKTSYTTLKEFAKKYCETFGMDRIQTEQFLRGEHPSTLFIRFHHALYGRKSAVFTRFF